jgi:hypothetical protein
MWQVIILILLACLSRVAPFQFRQTNRGRAPAVTDRPVKKLPVRAPKSADIQFAEFEFKLLSGGRHPGMFPIEGEPSKGVPYFVEATLYGTEAIATAKFEVVDEHGALIEPARIRRETNSGGDSAFYGVMAVPDRPFRVVVTGEGIDGERYQRIHERLFRPIDRPVVQPLIVEMASPADAEKMSKWVEEAMKQELAKIEEDLNKSGGWIVMPHTRVFNVNYQPLLSSAGRPRGLRITYDVEFSENGFYNPELHLFPKYEDIEWRLMVRMKVIDSSIDPQPAEAGSPQVRPHPLAYDAGYIYLGRTTYRFTADMVPDYVIQNEAKTKFCLWNQRYAHDPPNVRATYRAMVTSKAPTTYRVYVDNSDFDGLIENFYGLGVFYSTFAVEGASDCGLQPTIHF